MYIAWGLFVPGAILWARFGDKKSPTAFWFRMHRLWMATAGVLCAAGFVFAFLMGVGKHMSQPHHYIGAGLMGVVLVQGVLGVCRPKKKVDWQKAVASLKPDPKTGQPVRPVHNPEPQGRVTPGRRVWHIVHGALGYGAYIAAFVNCALGIGLMWGYRSRSYLYGHYGVGGVVFIVFGVMAAFQWCETGKKPAPKAGGTGDQGAGDAASGSASAGASDGQDGGVQMTTLGGDGNGGSGNAALAILAAGATMTMPMPTHTQYGAGGHQQYAGGGYGDGEGEGGSIAVHNPLHGPMGASGGSSTGGAYSSGTGSAGSWGQRYSVYGQSQPQFAPPYPVPGYGSQPTGMYGQGQANGGASPALSLSAAWDARPGMGAGMGAYAHYNASAGAVSSYPHTHGPSSEGDVEELARRRWAGASHVPAYTSSQPPGYE